MNKINALNKIDVSYLKVRNLFYSLSEKEFNLTEVSKMAKVSKSDASKTIKKLLIEKIIVKKVVGRSWVLLFNRTVENFNKKIPYNLDLIMRSNILDKIKKDYPNSKAIILFGSYREGDDHEKSDIDFAIELPGKGIDNIRENIILEDIAFRKNVAVSLHMFTRDAINPHLFANISNGIVLEGFLER